MSRPVDFSVLLPHLFHPPGAEAKNLDVLQAVNAFQHQGFHLPQPGAVAHSHAPSGFDGSQREDYADDQVNRQQHGGKQRLEPQRQPQGDAGQEDNGKHGADGMGEEKFHRFNVRNGNIQNIPLFPVHQAGGSQLPDSLVQMHPHTGQKPIRPRMGDHALGIPSQDDEQGGKRRQPAVQPGGAPDHPRAGQQQQRAKAHQPHLGKIPDNAGKRGNQ